MPLLSELKRRNVLRAAALYLAGAWLAVQIATQVFPFFDIPNSIVRGVVVALAVGFPFWLLLAWFYELTPDGLRREAPAAAERPAAPRPSHRAVDAAIFGALAAAVALLVAGRATTERPAQRTATAAQPVAAATSAPVSDRSIAVLPLVNASGHEDQQFFSDGLSENLIIALSKFDGLKVIGRNSSFQFRGANVDAKTVGAKLGVAHVLEGSVQHAGDEVRISTELVRTEDGSTLWSQRYDRPYADLFALQDEITQDVAAALEAKLLTTADAAQAADRPPGGNLDAYNAYLQGLFHMKRASEADLRKAIDAFTQATRLDARYAAAWTQLAGTWITLAILNLAADDAREAHAQARKALDVATALAPDLAQLHTTRGYYLGAVEFDWLGAEAEYRRATQLAPGDATARSGLANALASLGRVGEAVPLARSALADDPLHASWWRLLGAYLVVTGRLDEARDAALKAVTLYPESDSSYTQLAVVEIVRGDAAAALAAARKEPGHWRDIALALAAQIGPDRAAATASLERLVATQADAAALQIAEVYALRRDADRTFEWLHRALDDRDPGVVQLLYDPFLLRYRDDARFAAFCAQAGLPATTDARALP
ncbi:MAG TPA: tetratricopeptide repeat protein [Dokdonella sp.]